MVPQPYAIDLATPATPRLKDLASILQRLGCVLVRKQNSSKNGEAVKIKPIALDIVAGGHILQPASNGRVEPEPTGQVEVRQPLREKCRPIDLHTHWIDTLDEPPTKPDLPIFPRRRCTHSDFAKRPEMGALVGLLVVLVNEVGLQSPSCKNKVVGKREPASLSSESKGEISHLGVRLPARSACPSCDQSLFDSHDTVEIGNKMFVGDFGDIGKRGPFEATDLFHPTLAYLDQGRNLDEWPGATSANDIASLAEHHHATYFVQHDRGPGLDALSICRQCIDRLFGSWTVRTQKIGEVNKFQAGIQRDISLTPDLESLINLLFVLSGQRHESLAFPIGRPLGTDGAGLCRNVRPILLSRQKKRGRLRSAHVPGLVGKGYTLTLHFRNAFLAPHGFGKATVPKQVKPGYAHAFINVQEHSTGAPTVAPVKMQYRREHFADHSIMPRGHWLAVGPIVDASTRDLEQVA